MSKVKVDTKGIDTLIRKVNKIKSFLTFRTSESTEFRKYLDIIGKKILSITKKETPVGDASSPGYHIRSQFHTDKKHLRDAWEWSLTIKGTIIEGFVLLKSKKLNDLVNLLVAGSPPHTISSTGEGVLTFYVRVGGGWEKVYSKSVNHPGFSANLFIERAKLKSEVHIKKISSVVQNEINKIMLGK